MVKISSSESLHKQNWSFNFVLILSLVLSIFLIVCGTLYFGKYKYKRMITQTEEVCRSGISPVCYITDTGSRYHAVDCRYLSNSMHKTTVAEARKNGYTACSACSIDPIVTAKYTYVETLKKETEVPDIQTSFFVAFFIGSGVFFSLMAFPLYKRSHTRLKHSHVIMKNDAAPNFKTPASVLFCRKCGIKLKPRSQYCHICGTKVEEVTK